jgi:hypothetical protein
MYIDSDFAALNSSAFQKQNNPPADLAPTVGWDQVPSIGSLLNTPPTRRSRASTTALEGDELGVFPHVDISNIGLFVWVVKGTQQVNRGPFGDLVDPVD